MTDKRTATDGTADSGLQVDCVEFARASDLMRGTGCLGFVSLRVGQLRLDGLALRRKADGRLALSYPSRRDRRNRDHPYVRPIDEFTRRAIEAEVFAALGLEEES